MKTPSKSGIVSYGAHIPYNRISREEITKSWDGYPARGEKAVANFDEDVVTMAVEASRNCLGGRELDAFFLASTSFAYGEKQSTALAAAALDLNKDTFTMDIAGSLRAGADGVAMALNTINAGAGKAALVAAADMRLGAPSGNREKELGDGAAALLIGDSDVVAEITYTASINEDIFDVYRPNSEKYIKSWEDRFIRQKGYTAIVTKAVSKALQESGLIPADFSRAIFSAPNPGFLKGIAKKLGFDPKTQAMDPLLSSVGFTGTPHGMIQLCAALDDASPGDKILWASYGDGCNVIILTVTDLISKLKTKTRISDLLEHKNLIGYQKYLRWRNILETEPPMRPATEPASAVALYRDRKCGMSLHGSKCEKCGTVQYPVQRVCMECRAVDQFTYHGFADREGKIVTFSHDLLGVTPDPPTTVAAVDFEEGGRIMMDITDRKPEEIHVGMPVRMTFRKFREHDGITVYWWKGMVTVNGGGVTA